jgi:2-dehydropantoate 2-reductase
MHRDYQNLKPNTEVETLSGYVVRAAREFGIETPAFAQAYNQLKSKNQNH